MFCRTAIHISAAPSTAQAAVIHDAYDRCSWTGMAIVRNTMEMAKANKERRLLSSLLRQARYPVMAYRADMPTLKSPSHPWYSPHSSP